MQNLLALVLGVTIFVSIRFIELNFLGGEPMPFMAMAALTVVIIAAGVKCKKLALFVLQKLEKE